LNYFRGTVRYEHSNEVVTTKLFRIVKAITALKLVNKSIDRFISHLSKIIENRFTLGARDKEILLVDLTVNIFHMAFLSQRNIKPIRK